MGRLLDRRYLFDKILLIAFYHLGRHVKCPCPELHVERDCSRHLSRVRRRFCSSAQHMVRRRLCSVALVCSRKEILPECTCIELEKDSARVHLDRVIGYSVRVHLCIIRRRFCSSLLVYN